jgi:glucose/arabinose dehydrogenase
MLRKLLFLFLFPFAIHAQTFWQTTVIAGLDRPVAFDIAPDGRIFLTLKGGISGPATTAQIKVYDANYNYLGQFYDLSDSTDADFERGLIGIALDPDFVTNHFVYVYYVHLYNGDERLRIARFTENNNVGTNPTIIFDYDVPDNIPGIHVAGNLHFRPSEPGQLYFTIGDLGSDQTDTALNYAHMLTNPYGKTLRINKDGTIPTNNPFYDDGNVLTGNCDVIWSYGHRNPFDFCFSPVNDSFYVSENGLVTWDELNLIHRGKNYGWNKCEGFYENGSTTQLCNDTTSVLPMTEWGAPLGGITGILFYTGNVLPGIDNHLLVADYDYGRIFDVALGNAPMYDTALSNTLFYDDVNDSGGLTTIREASDGCILAMKGGYWNNGKIMRICPSWMDVESHENNFFSLQQNFPNPFSNSTTINYFVKQNTEIKIVLYDISGREIKILRNESEQVGSHELKINAKELGLSPGNYFCSFQSGEINQSVKVSVVD